MTFKNTSGADKRFLGILMGIVEERHKHLRPLVAEIGNRPLTDADRQALREVVAEEMIASGLDNNEEPTDRGIELEGLIDWLGRI